MRKRQVLTETGRQSEHSVLALPECTSSLAPEAQSVFEMKDSMASRRVSRRTGFACARQLDIRHSIEILTTYASIPAWKHRSLSP